MTNQTATRALLTLASLGALASLLTYPWLPALLPVHWNLRGQPDGFAPKSVAAFLGPLGVMVLLASMRVLPALTPRVREFAEVYRYIFAVLGALFTHIHAITLLSGLFPSESFSRPLFAGLSVAMALLGNVLGKVKRNPWIGIRTPWTLADERVWERTHRRGARLIFAAGAFGAALALLGAPLEWGLILLLVAALEPALYSWLIRNEGGAR